MSNGSPVATYDPINDRIWFSDEGKDTEKDTMVVIPMCLPIMFLFSLALIPHIADLSMIKHLYTPHPK